MTRAKAAVCQARRQGLEVRRLELREAFHGPPVLPLSLGHQWVNPIVRILRRVFARIPLAPSNQDQQHP